MATPTLVLDTDPRTSLLSVFNGMSADGEWRLFVADLSKQGAQPGSRGGSCPSQA